MIVERVLCPASKPATALRSCLDQLAWQLVLLDGGTPGDHTAFPLIRKPGNWESGGGGALKGVGKDHVDAIEALQP